MSSIAIPKVKISSAAKRFVRYHPKQNQELEDKIAAAKDICLWDFLDRPKLYDKILSEDLNLDNFNRLKRTIRHQNIKINFRHEYTEICLFRLLGDFLKTTNVKDIKTNYILQEIDFENNIKCNLNQLLKSIDDFSAFFFDAPWRKLYPLISENLKINGFFNNEELWENLESNFKNRVGNAILKETKLSIQYFDESMAIIFVDYQLKLHSKSATHSTRLKILARYKLGVWQISELINDYFFTI